MSNEKMTIEVNMGNLSEYERAQFKLLIEKANTPPQKKNGLVLFVEHITKEI